MTILPAATDADSRARAPGPGRTSCRQDLIATAEHDHRNSDAPYGRALLAPPSCHRCRVTGAPERRLVRLAKPRMSSGAGFLERVAGGADEVLDIGGYGADG